jgi:hypothetical protein
VSRLESNIITLKHTNPLLPKTTKLEMASNFSLAIDKMVRERDEAFLRQVAEDYKLPFAELQTKYLATAEAVVKVKRPYKKREPKMVEITNENGEKVQVPVKADKEESTKEKKTCEAQTSKKEACKFSALKGGCFCKRHQRQHDEEQSGEPAPKKQKKEVVKKQEQPLHNHALDTKGEACDLCESHGNPLVNGSDDFEIVMPTEAEQAAPPKKTAEERLAAMLEDSDDSESEDEAEATGFGSEYEDEE